MANRDKWPTVTPRRYGVVFGAESQPEIFTDGATFLNGQCALPPADFYEHDCHAAVAPEARYRSPHPHVAPSLPPSRPHTRHFAARSCSHLASSHRISMQRAAHTPTPHLDASRRISPHLTSRLHVADARVDAAPPALGAAGEYYVSG